MSMIRPFRAVRPQKELAASVAALPYDVYNTEEARKITAEEPLSFLRIDRAETQLPEGTDPYSDIVYRKAREILDRMLSDGSFIQEEKGLLLYICPYHERQDSERNCRLRFC